MCKTNREPFPDFLLKHVQNDLKRIQRVLDLNFDDVMILLHRLNFSMLASFIRKYTGMTKISIYASLINSVCRNLCCICFIETYRGNSDLRSKDERQKWETDFQKDVLDPIILV